MIIENGRLSLPEPVPAGEDGETILRLSVIFSDPVTDRILMELTEMTDSPVRITIEKIGE